MNVYPFEVAGLPPPPPPPPPPVPSSAPAASSSDPSFQRVCYQSYVQTQNYNQHYQETVGQGQFNFAHKNNISAESSNLRTRAGHQDISQIFRSSSADGVIMLPPDQLRLPPPPPPPPPPQHSLPSTPHQPCNVSSDFVTHSSSTRTHKQCYTSVPPPWVASKQVPAGLQGPWKSSELSNRVAGDDSDSHLHGATIQKWACTDSTSNANSPVKSSGPSTTPAAITYKDHKVDPKEPGLPRELTDLFEALHCKLCEVLSSSTVQAKLHYSGKPHEKKVRQWLLNWSEKTGLPVPKRPKMDSKVDVKPEDMYCDLCDVAFTSVKHGEQHKMGKAHQKAVRFGYSNAKMKQKKVEVPFDPSGRFGIGEAFCKDKVSDEDKDDPATDNSSTCTNIRPVCNKSSCSKFVCELCNISATSKEHLDAHYSGAKHRKALANAAKNDGSNIQPSIVPPPVEPSESILASVMDDNNSGPSKSRGLSNDLSIYRTPSGQFYCHPCNTTVNSEKTFREHTESKRHKYKVASLKRS